jgi:hypothetical protein
MNAKQIIFSAIIILQSFFGVSSVAQNTGDTLFLERLLRKHPDKFKKEFVNPEKHRVQIIYTQIDRDKNNVPSFREFRYRVKRENYFYCASLVKLPASALSLEKMHSFSVEGLNSRSPMLTDSVSSCQKKTDHDSTSSSGLPSLSQYIKRMLLISDNEAYSRTYEFLGRDYIHDQLKSKGYPDAFIIQRFDSGCNTDDNACTNPIRFMDPAGSLLYKQDAQCGSLTMLHPLGKPHAGLAYIDKNEKKINEPKDFSQSNFLPLEDITKMLRSLVFPESVSPDERFKITEEDRLFLLRYMSMLPRESDYPKYNPKNFYDSYKKYLIYGDTRAPIQQDSLRIFNIVGQSYGFVSDVAYICDFKNKVEFMLSAVIYTNEDEIINDNKYEYKSVALPFMAELGKLIYNYDRNRKRQIKPRLEEFSFDYK